jgi:hypothetical protein
MDDILRAPRAARRAAWTLAAEFGHAWGAIPEAAIDEGGDALVAAWEAVRAEAHPALPAGIAPALNHVTGSGRITWTVSPVETVIEIRRPSGAVITIAVPHAGRRIEVRHLVAERVFERHIMAIRWVVTALRGAEAALAVETALLDAGVSRPSYWQDASARAAASRLENGGEHVRL